MQINRNIYKCHRFRKTSRASRNLKFLKRFYWIYL